MRTTLGVMSQDEQHEANHALLGFAESDNNSTVILPAGTSVAPLINTNASAPSK